MPATACLRPPDLHPVNSIRVTPHTSPPSHEPDELGSNHLYVLISERLHVIGLDRWTRGLLNWLYRYDGIECCYFGDEETCPEQQVLELLNMVAPGVEDVELASELAQLPFVSWRMADESGRRWDFRAEHCQNFLSQIGASGTPNCWAGDTPWPSESAVIDWLLEQSSARES